MSGSQQPQADESLERRVHALLANGQNVDAFKLYREETGLGLADSKHAVESMLAGGSLPAHGKPEDSGLENELLRLLSDGKKIQAIKLFREQNGGGLKDAKEAVEALGAKHGIVSRGGGCMGVAVIIVGFIAALLAIGRWSSWKRA